MRIVDFGDQAPGGGPASLLRSMDLAMHVSAAHFAAPAYIRWMKGLVRRPMGPIPPGIEQQVTRLLGQTVLRIQFDAPSPLS